MDRDTIIRLAREAGLEILSLDGEDEVGCGDNYHIQTDLIERFAALVAAAEREACARVCDAEANRIGWPTERFAADNCAFLIRARGEQK